MNDIRQELQRANARIEATKAMAKQTRILIGSGRSPPIHWVLEQIERLLKK